MLADMPPYQLHIILAVHIVYTHIMRHPVMIYYLELLSMMHVSRPYTILGRGYCMLTHYGEHYIAIYMHLTLRMLHCCVLRYTALGVLCHTIVHL
jgi:hypothetical protein